MFEGNQFCQRFPFLRFRDPVVGVVDPGAGVIMADQALRAILDLARATGVTVRDGCAVTGVESLEGGVRVTTDQGEFTCTSVVLTPGPWAGDLLGSLGLNLPLRPVKIPVYYWRYPSTVEWCRGATVWQ